MGQLCVAKQPIFSRHRAYCARKAMRKKVKDLQRQVDFTDAVFEEEAVAVLLGLVCQCVCGVAKVGGTVNWFRAELKYWCLGINLNWISQFIG